MSAKTRGVLIVVWGMALGFPVFAGILDAPPPDLGSGTTGIVVYRMGPVHFDPGHVDTVIRCTNLSEAPIAVGVEIFGEAGELEGLWRRESLAPQQVFVFATGPAPNLPDASVPVDLEPIEHGKARVSATTSRLVCDAQHVVWDGRSGGPAKTSVLELVKKVARETPPASAAPNPRRRAPAAPER